MSNANHASPCLQLHFGHWCYCEPMRTNPFSSAKVTQAAARLLELRKAPMSYMKLLKLLYLADREALRTLGRAISGDRHVCMDHGPVLSLTYQLISDPPCPEENSYWHKHISPPQGEYEVQLLSPPGNGLLSEAEEEILDRVFSERGHLSRWDLVKFTHTLPEWHDPNGSSMPIQLSEMLGVSDVEAERQKAEMDEQNRTLSLMR